MKCAIATVVIVLGSCGVSSQQPALRDTQSLVWTFDYAAAVATSRLPPDADLEQVRAECAAKFRSRLALAGLMFEEKGDGDAFVAQVALGSPARDRLGRTLAYRGQIAIQEILQDPDPLARRALEMVREWREDARLTNNQVSASSIAQLSEQASSIGVRWVTLTLEPSGSADSLRWPPSPNFSYDWPTFPLFDSDDFETSPTSVSDTLIELVPVREGSFTLDGSHMNPDGFTIHEHGETSFGVWFRVAPAWRSEYQAWTATVARRIPVVSTVDGSAVGVYLFNGPMDGIGGAVVADTRQEASWWLAVFKSGVLPISPTFAVEAIGKPSAGK